MAVYNTTEQRRYTPKINNNIYKRTAADLPPDNKSYETRKTENLQAKDYIQHKKDISIFDELLDHFFKDGIDSEKLIIALLLYMLIKEGADIKLIIALGYILI